MTLSALSF